MRGLVRDLPHNVETAVSIRRELLYDFTRRVEFALDARSHALLDEHRVGLVAHLEDVFAADETEAGVRRLRIVQRLAHVALPKQANGGHVSEFVM